MKNSILVFLLVFTIVPAWSQLKPKIVCDAFVVDVLDGKVNDVHADFTPGQIKAKLPCFTGEDPETSKCGSVIYYKDRDVKFYPTRKYVEVGPGFKGKFTFPIMGEKRGSFFKKLGVPKLKDAAWDAFETQYGCLILYYNSASKVRMIRFSALTTDEINLCE